MIRAKTHKKSLRISFVHLTSCCFAACLQQDSAKNKIDSFIFFQDPIKRLNKFNLSSSVNMEDLTWAIYLHSFFFTLHHALGKLKLFHLFQSKRKKKTEIQLCLVLYSWWISWHHLWAKPFPVWSRTDQKKSDCFNWPQQFLMLLNTASRILQYKCSKT